MPLSVEDLAARRPVWDALSELFLDTDVSIGRERRARQLAASPYPIEVLEAILRDEVFPICSWNLLSIAGEWRGFDLEWLEQKILARMKRRRRIRLGFGHLLVTRSREWRRTRERIVVLRRSSSCSRDRRESRWACQKGATIASPSGPRGLERPACRSSS